MCSSFGSRLLFVQWTFSSCLRSAATSSESLSAHPVVKLVLVMSSRTVENRRRDDVGRHSPKQGTLREPTWFPSGAMFRASTCVMMRSELGAGVLYYVGGNSNMWEGDFWRSRHERGRLIMALSRSCAEVWDVSRSEHSGVDGDVGVPQAE